MRKIIFRQRISAQTHGHTYRRQIVFLFDLCSDVRMVQWPEETHENSACWRKMSIGNVVQADKEYVLIVS